MGKMKTLPINKVQKETVKVELSEDWLKTAAPSMPSSERAALIDAVKQHKFEEHQAINEKAIFDNLYTNISKVVFKELGVRALKMFARYKKIAQAATLKLVKEEADSTLRGANAEGTEFTIRALSSDTWGLNPSDMVWSIDTGTNDAYPRTAGYHSLPEDKEAVLLFGYWCSMNQRSIESVQEDLEDAGGLRKPTNFMNANVGDMMLVSPNGGPRYIESGSSVDIDISGIKATDVDFRPLGLDIVMASEVSNL